MWGRLVLIAVAGTLLTGGCGGGDGAGGKSERSADSKRFHAQVVTFHRRGQAICREVGRAGAAFIRSIRQGDPVGGLRRMVAAADRGVRRLAALDPPGTRLARYKRRVLALERKNLAHARAALARMERGLPFLQAYASFERKNQRSQGMFNRLYRRLGLPACTSDELNNAARRGL